MNVARWSQENLERFGDYDALVVGPRVWRNQTLHAYACRIAASLMDRGLRPGDRVLLLVSNGAELISSFTAALMSGGVVVPLFAGAAAGEVERVLAHCTPAAIVADTARLEEIRLPENGPTIRICVGGAPPAGWIPFESLVEPHLPAATMPIEREADDPALICYTSGTSGSPKGVVYTHGGIRARHEHMSARSELINSSSTMLITLPMSTVGASALTGRLAERRTLVIFNEFDAAACLSAIGRHRVTSFLMVPAMAEALIAAAARQSYDLSSLRRITVTGAAVLPRVRDALAETFGLTPTIGYGMTEAGGPIAETTTTSKKGAVGITLPGVQLRVCDENNSPLPAGEVGDIQVMTPWMSIGYYQRDDDTAALFSNGWLRTGDLGYVDADANLFVVGSRNEVINQGGVKVYPVDLAEIIRDLPGVEECAVVGVPHPILGQSVAACVVRRPSSPLTEDDVIAHCRAHVDPRHAPVHVRLLDALPRTPTNKVKTEALRKQVAASRHGSGTTDLMRQLRFAPTLARVPTLSEVIERELARTLHTAGSARHRGEDAGATFGERGLDSVGAARLVDALSTQLGRLISPTVIFSHPTVDALSRHLVAEWFASPSQQTAVVRRTPQASHDAIAIVGLSCRLPGEADTPERFWSLLRDARDTTRDTARWNIDPLFDKKRGTPGKMYTRRSALLERIDLFDAEFFGISPYEASRIDPQHRLALELAWESLEDAGYDPLGWSEQRVGVFLGISRSSYRSDDGLGTASSMAVGRICHFLNLRGPATVVDTACSSSLFAVHSAVQSLRSGECDLALAGGVHVIASPQSFVALSQIGVLAADGRCKTFSGDGDGYGRGEGGVIVAFKRLSDAQAHGDRIIAVIRGSAATHDGRSSSLTTPNGEAQRAVILTALADAGASPSDVDYLEAHGAGTALGDPIEVEAAVSALGPRERPLVIGSVKTNVGHLEAAAGAVALMKVAMSLQHREIPAHLHGDPINPLLAPLAGAIEIPRAHQPWPQSPDHRRLAGITSMGLSGTNVHVVVEEAPDAASAADIDDRSLEAEPQLLCLSARTPSALAEQTRRHADALARVTSFSDYCFTANAGRAHFAHRVSVVETTAAAAREQLLSMSAGPFGATSEGNRTRSKVAFLFSGHGAQYVGMSRRLFETEPAFRAALQRCDAIIAPIASRSIVDALYGEPAANGGGLDDVGMAQAAICALQWSLCELWKSWGIEPDVVLGHSLGECAAAIVSGLLSVEDGLRLAAARGRLMQSLGRAGGMIAVRAGEDVVRKAIGAHGAEVSVAAVNGPASTVVSGAREALAVVEQLLIAQGVEARHLAIPRAGHSPLMDPILDAVEEAASALTYMPLRVGFVSTLTGEVAAHSQLSRSTYWRRQMREPVQFAKGIRTLLAQDVDVFVEIGPHAVLIGMGAECDAAGGRARTWLASLRRDRDDRTQILETLGALYAKGVNPNWRAIYQDSHYRRVALPTYPFQRKSYWTDVAPVGGEPTALVDSLQDRAHDDGETSTADHAVDSDTVLRRLRQHVATVIGCDADGLSPDMNLLALGLDSLRVLDIVSGVRARFGVRCAPADLLAEPTLAGLAAYVTAEMRRSNAVVGSGGERSPSPSPSQAGHHRAAPESPLVVLNGRGRKTPLFCVHPSGGQPTAYLRLRQLLGDEQPLLAIQSRALQDPEREHTSIDAMAIDYATVVQSARGGPYRLAGWSMGGWIAHAVALELERRGARVEMVGMIDPVDVRMHATRSSGDELRFALTAVVHELWPAATIPADAIAELDLLSGLDLEPANLAAWAIGRRLLPDATSVESVATAIGLYRRHLALVRNHRPGIIDAPLVQWWSDNARGTTDWSAHTRSGVTTHVVGGTHFSIVQSPRIETIAADLAMCERAPEAGALERSVA